MRGLQTTLFVIAFVILGTQLFRHSYVKWIEPRSSALDAFKEPVDSVISSASTLEGLVALYRQAHDSVQGYERNSANPEIPFHERDDTEPYASERKLRREIEQWEMRTKEIFQVRFFWALGFLSVVLGAWCHKKWNAWIGMASIIAGFSEMAYWTSPLLNTFDALPEFERLLNTKLFLSLVSWTLLTALWLWHDKWGKASTPTSAA